ncbi:MAG TPA: TonB family protein [Pyrinomonadaceae bacterium]|nr:TonB family protein [Pyrinomonadaceae bacterium]
MKYIATFAFVLLCAGLAAAQVAPKVRHPAIALFEKGKFAEAATAFEIATKTDEFKADAEIWNYLGLSYLAIGKVKNGRKAFEKSVALNASNAIYRSNLAYASLMSGDIGKARESAEKAIALDPKKPGPYEVRGTANFWQRKLDQAERDAELFVQLDPANPQAYLLKSDILIAKLGEQLMSSKTSSENDYLKRANETLETGAAKCKATAICAEIAHRHEAIAAFYEHFSRDRTSPTLPGTVPVPEPDVTPIKIKRQPPAHYTDEARNQNVQGAIRVAILLGASGKVEYILFLSRLGFGLEQEVVKAVREIRFEPRTKNGKPVSTVVIREYTFSIY